MTEDMRQAVNERTAATLYQTRKEQQGMPLASTDNFLDFSSIMHNSVLKL